MYGAEPVTGAVRSRQREPWQIASPLTFWIVIAVFFGLFVLRRPDSLTNPQFWAEDGTIIFREQLLHGWLAALAIPYRGYFPLLPRLVAGPLSIFSVALAPFAYNLIGILIDSFCSALFFLPRYRYCIESDSLRLALCVLAVGAFQTTELVGTLSNSMWYLGLAAILITLLPPEVDMRVRPAVAAGWFFLGVVIGGCAPMALVGLPIGIYYLVRNFWRGGMISFAVGLGALVQALFATLSTHGLTMAHPGARGIAHAMLGGFAYKVVLQTLLGAPFAFKLAVTKKIGYVLLSVVLAAAGITGLIAVSRRCWWKVLIPVYLIFSSMGLAFVGRDEAQFFANLTSVDLRGERYFFLASCAFAYLVAYALDRAIPSRREILKALALVVIFSGGLFGNFHQDRFEDLHWRAGAERIQAWVQLRESGKRASAVSVPINPPGWRIDLPSL